MVSIRTRLDQIRDICEQAGLVVCGMRIKDEQSVIVDISPVELSTDQLWNKLNQKADARFDPFVISPHTPSFTSVARIGSVTFAWFFKNK